MINKLLRNITAISVLLMTLTACQTTPSGPDTEFLAAVLNNKPTSILVVPVNNETIDVMAPTSVLATLPITLGERGYYVFPVNTVKTLLEAEGYYEPAEVHAAPTSSLTELFGADTVLYVTIHEWDAKYLLLKTTTVVDFEYTLKSNSGDVLWTARQKLTYTPDGGNSGNPLADLIAGAISAAIERASPNYLPLTRQANHQAFYNYRRGLPPGPHSPYYNAYYELIDKNTSTTTEGSE
ncbi:DUF799 domain-containing protein [Aliidiomarina quisquiliarum]|uniref:DUF799 domain-containing protein n=1 Tax=Aliidiomarina quisquiliarum TaxID=2938947 RepID=UPI00208DE06C|nr:GNA1162 family protein [Aliidiomarina quisquiliarum]MCO4322581.1 DUF799 domain-containing protein [Aliidiomarina quisquiliarum]